MIIVLAAALVSALPECGDADASFPKVEMGSWEHALCTRTWQDLELRPFDGREIGPPVHPLADLKRRAIVEVAFADCPPCERSQDRAHAFLEDEAAPETEFILIIDLSSAESTDRVRNYPEKRDEAGLDYRIYVSLGLGLYAKDAGVVGPTTYVLNTPGGIAVGRVRGESDIWSSLSTAVLDDRFGPAPFVPGVEPPLAASDRPPRLLWGSIAAGAIVAVAAGYFVHQRIAAARWGDLRDDLQAAGDLERARIAGENALRASANAGGGLSAGVLAGGLVFGVITAVLGVD